MCLIQRHTDAHARKDERTHLLERPRDERDEVLGGQRHQAQDGQHEEDDGHGGLVDGDIDAWFVCVDMRMNV